MGMQKWSAFYLKPGQTRTRREGPGKVRSVRSEYIVSVSALKLDSQVSHKGKSALARAARKGHSEVVRHLLDAKAAAGDALLSALSSGHAEVVRMLLDATFSESFERDTKRQRTSFDTLV